MLPAPPRIAVVAGEASGDALGAGFIEAVRVHEPGAGFIGMTGPRMRALNCTTLAHSDEIAVMGLAEVLGHLPRLLRLRARLVDELAAARPDVFVGIDAPDFNLGLAQRLRRRTGVPTVQYVSPQFWAWRSGRVRRMHRSVDHVLCLLPFEADFYADHGVGATFTGHPLADRIPLSSDREAARRELALEVGEGQGPVVAVLPGSRSGEVRRLGTDLVAAMAWLRERLANVRFVAAMASPALRTLFEEMVAVRASALPLTLVDGRSTTVMAAADVVLLASGTATLEALLIKRPMVVCYRVSAVSAWIARRFQLMTTEKFAMPNLLAGEDLVPEIMQEAVSGEALGRAVLEQLEMPPAQRARMEGRFVEIHHSLRRDASARAAQAVLELLAARRIAS